MQKNSVTDVELILKKKARRRLVGAIALVLLLIILLPFLLKDRATLAEKGDVKITIDNQVEQAINSEAPVVVAEGFDSSVVSADDEAAAKEAVVVHEQVSDHDVGKLKSVEEKQPVVETKPREEVLAIESVKKEVATGAYCVQVGVFSNAESVKKLQASLTELGYKSRAEKIATSKGEKIRLRTYAFSSKNEAVIALENIKDAGLTGMVVSQ
jgi:DedD protein